MRGKDFLDKMELIDPAYIEAADKPAKKKNNFVKWTAIAACLSIVLLAGFFAFRVKNNTLSVSFGGITRDYKKDLSITADEAAIVWPWEYKTISEQYTTVIVDGRKFISRGRPINASLLGETIGTYDVVGFDFLTEKEYRMVSEVRCISHISKNYIVAVNLGGEFYVFQYSEYEQPANLGEVLDYYSLAQTLNFDRFTIRDNSAEKEYLLNDDQYIWDILNTCRDAKFIEKDNVWDQNKKYIGFTATSDALGVYKRVFYVTSDGYIETNIFDFRYTFEIGADAANQIISYAAENSAECAMEPYTYSLAGTLVEITDEFIFIDDSILCSNQSKGMVFKIPANDLRIRRHIDFEQIGVGDIVMVNFTGNIDVEAGNIVEGAYSLSRAAISDGEVFVNE